MVAQGAFVLLSRPDAEFDAARCENQGIANYEEPNVGHAIIVYRDRHAVIHDMDLCGIRHFLLAEAEASGSRDLADFVRGWEWVGNSVWIGEDFDAFFNGRPTREQEFVKMLDATRARLEAFGENIPKAYFTANPGAFFTEAQPVCRLVEQLTKLYTLFATEQS